MATLNLLPRKEFEITLDDSTIIKGQFGTWALKRMCDKRGYATLQALRDALTDSIGMTDIIEFVLCAVEQKARQTGAAFSYTDVHCGQWLDEIGGINSENFGKLFIHAKDEIEKKTIEMPPLAETG